MEQYTNKKSPQRPAHAQQADFNRQAKQNAQGSAFSCEKSAHSGGQRPLQRAGQHTGNPHPAAPHKPMYDQMLTYDTQNRSSAHVSAAPQQVQRALRERDAAGTHRQVQRTSAQQVFYRRAMKRRKRTRCLLAGGVLCLLGILALGAFMRSCVQTRPTAISFDASSSDNSVQETPFDNYVLPTKPPFIIAMDAGHGGDDTGATGIVMEVALTEMTVYYLNGWLKNDENYIPVRCHADGEGMSIGNRAQAAQDAGAHLLLSIHGNSSEDSTVQGFECFPTPPGRTYYAPSLRLAKLLAQGMGQQGCRLRGGSGVRYAYYEHGGEQDKTIVEDSDDVVRNAPTFGLLEKAPCPAVLIEQCFITNEDDVSNWTGETGSAQAARTYYEAICAYFDTQPLPQTQ